MKKRLDISSPVYIGYDESNHGRIPEFFVAVHSRLEKDLGNQHFDYKIRGSYQPLFGALRYRTYSFLQAEENDFERIPEKDFLGVVLASLLHKDISSDISSLKILIDGPVFNSEKNRIKDLVSEYANLGKEIITIRAEPHLDKNNRLVHLADGMAHYLFRKCSPEKLSKNPNRRYLIR